MKKTIVYGIPNCDVTKKAMAWLNKNKVAFEFHDYKKSGISISKLNEWSSALSWETILNKRGTTWKSISPEIQQTITNQKMAVQLMQEHTSLIKRPVIETGNDILTGFNEAVYKDKLMGK